MNTKVSLYESNFKSTKNNYKFGVPHNKRFTNDSELKE